MPEPTEAEGLSERELLGLSGPVHRATAYVYEFSPREVPDDLTNWQPSSEREPDEQTIHVYDRDGMRLSWEMYYGDASKSDLIFDCSAAPLTAKACAVRVLPQDIQFATMTIERKETNQLRYTMRFGEQTQQVRIWRDSGANTTHIEADIDSGPLDMASSTKKMLTTQYLGADGRLTHEVRQEGDKEVRFVFDRLVTDHFGNSLRSVTRQDAQYQDAEKPGYVRLMLAEYTYYE